MKITGIGGLCYSISMAWFNLRKDRDAAHLSVELPVTFIEEEDAVIAYTPALDLSTCGKNRKDAEQMFSEAARIFFNDLVENDTVEEVLSGLGWKKDSVRSSWIPPKISQDSIGVKVPALA